MRCLIEAKNVVPFRWKCMHMCMGSPKFCKIILHKYYHTIDIGLLQKQIESNDYPHNITLYSINKIISCLSHSVMNSELRTF
jgi:hypothetical protein